MHAYLLVGKESEDVKIKLREISDKISTQSYEFSLEKIEEVREFLKFISLSFSKPTTLVLRNLENSSIEAQNALLKSVEEPQKNVNFIICTTSLEKIADTIQSRCETIYLHKQKTQEDTSSLAKEFLGLSTGAKLEKITKIKKRDEALLFIEEFIQSGHQLIQKDQQFTKPLLLALEALKAIKSNGNIQLHLTNFVGQQTV